MAVPRQIPAYVTEEEFLALPVTMERLELVDGEVIVPPSPTWRHQHDLGELYYALRTWSRGHPPATVVMAPCDVRFGPGRILQPDLFVVLGGIPDDAPMPLDVVPDLVVEVLSARGSHDRLAKRVVYAEAGVPEYWVVDGVEQKVEVYFGLQSGRVVDDALASEQLPGFALDLKAFFGRRPCS